MGSRAVPFLTVLTEVAGTSGGPLYVIVSRKYVYLADLLTQAVRNREDVHIVVDRRFGERRTRRQSVPVDWRRGDRRRPREEMLQVVIAGPRESGETPP